MSQFSKISGIAGLVQQLPNCRAWHTCPCHANRVQIIFSEAVVKGQLWHVGKFEMVNAACNL